MIDLCSFYLETDRLILQPISHIFRQNIFQEFQGEVTKYTNGDPPENIAQTDRFIHLSLLNLINGDDLTLVVLDRQNQEFLGCGGIHTINSRRPFVGIWLKKTAQGKGYGKEAIINLVGWVKNNLKVNGIRYEVDRDNLPSRKLVESIGGKIMTDLGTTQRITKSGKVLNLLVYEVSLK